MKILKDSPVIVIFILWALCMAFLTYFISNGIESGELGRSIGSFIGDIKSGIDEK